MTPTIRVQAEPFDAGAEIAALNERTRGACGGLATFSGFCRDEDGRLAALELEHYPGMAEAEIARIVDEAAARWPLVGATVIHRHGVIAAGEAIVLVATASAHRGPALEAAGFLMDFLKTRAPFWKREHRADGTLGEWVEAAGGDDAAAGRWARP